jgi:hypothetical protein
MRAYPQGSVASVNTRRKNGQDKLDILSGQRTQIHIYVVEALLISLTPGSPKGSDGSTHFIIETEGNVTERRATFTVHCGSETIAILHPERWEEALDVSIPTSLWRRREGEQAWAGIGCAGFQLGIRHFEHKAFGITIRARAWELTSTAVPSSRTGIGGKVVGYVRTRHCCRHNRCHRCARCDWSSRHPDVHPPGPVPLRANSEERATGIFEHPVAAIGTGRGRCRHVD